MKPAPPPIRTVGIRLVISHWSCIVLQLFLVAMFAVPSLFFYAQFRYTLSSDWLLYWVPILLSTAVLLLPLSLVVFSFGISLKLAAASTKANKAQKALKTLRILSFVQAGSFVFLLVLSLVVLYGDAMLKETVKLNLQRLFLLASRPYDETYHWETNQIQQQARCCGVLVESSYETLFGSKQDVIKQKHTYKTALDVWLNHLFLSEHYPLHIQKFPTLPWSCCRVGSPTGCRHLGFGRYSNATSLTKKEFAREENGIPDEWNSTRYEERESRAEKAFDSIYTADCGDRFPALMGRQFFTPMSGTIVGVAIMLLLLATHAFLEVRRSAPVLDRFMAKLKKWEDDEANRKKKEAGDDGQKNLKTARLRISEKKALRTAIEPGKDLLHPKTAKPKCTAENTTIQKKVPQAQVIGKMPEKLVDKMTPKVQKDLKETQAVKNPVKAPDVQKVQEAQKMQQPTKTADNVKPPSL